MKRHWVVEYIPNIKFIAKHLRRAVVLFDAKVLSSYLAGVTGCSKEEPAKLVPNEALQERENTSAYIHRERGIAALFSYLTLQP